MTDATPTAVSAAAPASAALFPLPLVPFESFMMADDRPAYPMTYVFQLVVSGRIERAAFERAVCEAAARHPLLSSHIVPIRGRVRGWLPCDEKPPIDWGARGEPLTAPYWDPLDLTKHVGLRVWVREGEQRSDLYFQFHHACCDGVGAYEFFDDLFTLYAAATTPDAAPPELRPLEPERLATRGTFGLEPVPWRQYASLWLTGLREAWKFLAQRPVPVVAATRRRRSAARLVPPEHPGYVVHTFEADKLRALRAAAEEQGVTLNDLLVRDLFLTVYEWNARHGRPLGDRRWLRVMVPCNVRRADDRTMPAANVMSYAFLNRRAGACRQPDELLASLREEIALAVRWRTSLYFIGAVATADAVPYALKAVVRAPRCFASAVLTNQGNPGQWFQGRFPRRAGRVTAGNLEIEQFFAVPPVRPGTAACFSVTVYGGQLTLSLKCDPYRFTVDQAAQLLAAYAARLGSSGQVV